MLYLIQGDEPYFIEKKLKEIRSKYDETLITDRLSGEEKTYLETVGMFGSHLLIVKSDSFGESDFSFVQKLHMGNNALVLVGKLAANTKFYKYLKKHGTVIACDRLAEENGPEFCAKALKRCGCRVTEQAAVLFMERSGYYLGDINLFQVENQLFQLSFMAKDITEREVLMLPEAKDVNRWKLVSVLQKNPREFMTKCVSLLGTESPIPLLSLILRAFRIGYKVTLVGAKNLSEIGITSFQYRGIRWIPEKLSASQIEAAMDILQRGIEEQKSTLLSPESAYVRTLGELIGVVQKGGAA